MIDLHIHSTYSDGNKTLKELIKMCRERNIKTISFTDHNTIKSKEELEKIIAEEKEFNIIRGIELYPLKDGVHGFHLLVYDFKLTEAFLELMEELDFNRYECTKEQINYANDKFNIDVDIDDLPDIWLSTHTIRLYLNNKYPEKVVNEIMDYINSLNIKVKKKVDYKKLFEIVNEAQGIPVLAHPKSVQCDDFDEFITDLKIKGLKGIEAYHSSHSKKDVKKYLEYARDANLLISGGSDYHGYGKKDYQGNDVLVGDYFGALDNNINIIQYIKRRKNV